MSSIAFSRSVAPAARGQLQGWTTSSSSASAELRAAGGAGGGGAARRQAIAAIAMTTTSCGTPRGFRGAPMLCCGARMRIGNVELTPGALLAPMEAVTDLPFRTVCEELGAALTFTEFLSAEALTRGATKAIGRMWASLGGRRFAVQIFGREPDALARAAGMAADVGAAIVDINMGCPAKKVTAGACGSALMREPALAAELVAAVRRAVPAAIPVTGKHRAGWDDSSLNAAEFARAVGDGGAAMITVQGRRGAQGFSGAARLEPIAAVRAALPREIPVVGNGDVKDVPAYERMRRETGCDAVMIGRGAMGNPWFF